MEIEASEVKKCVYGCKTSGNTTASFANRTRSAAQGSVERKRYEMTGVVTEKGQTVLDGLLGG